MPNGAVKCTYFQLVVNDVSRSERITSVVKTMQGGAITTILFLVLEFPSNTRT